MAANTSENGLPVLPAELLRMIVLNFQWTNDLDDLIFAWLELRSVSSLFKETVEHFFKIRHLPATFMRLLEFGCCCIPDSYSGFEFDLDVRFERLSADGDMAIFGVHKPVWAPKFEEQGYILEMREDLIRSFHWTDLIVWITPNLHTFVGAIEADPVTLDISIPWKKLYSQFLTAERKEAEEKLAYAMEIERVEGEKLIDMALLEGFLNDLNL